MIFVELKQDGMKGLKYVILLILLSSCATQKNFDRLLAKDPSLIDKYISSKDTLIQRDTFRYSDTTIVYDTTYVEYQDEDTSFLRKDSFSIDTFYHITNKVSVRVIITPTGVHFKTSVKPDTVLTTEILIVEKEVIKEKIVYTERIATWKVWQNWLIHKWKTVISVIVILLILWFFGRRLL